MNPLEMTEAARHPPAPSRTTGSGRLGRFGKLGVSGFGFLLALVVLELALRLVPQAIPPRLLILFEPNLRSQIASGAYPLQKDFLPVERDDGGPPLYVAKPNTRIVSIDQPAGGAERFTDELGFCNVPGRYHAQERIDVIALGDSFTWCHGVLPQQTWPMLLGERSGVAVFSLGMGGSGPYEYLQYLRTFGLPKHPRVVVMNIYGGNDLRDAAAYAQYRAAVEQGTVPPSASPRPIAPALVDNVIGRHSYALNLLLAFASRMTSQAGIEWERKGIDVRSDLPVGNETVAFNPENRDRDEVVSARHLEDGTTPLDVWDDALKRFAALGREHGFTPVVSYTPSFYAVYDDRLRMADASVSALLQRFDRRQRDFLAERATATGFVFHDFTPALQAASGPGALLYDPVNLHLSRRGNEVLAESMAARLSAQKAASVASR